MSGGRKDTPRRKHHKSKLTLPLAIVTSLTLALPALALPVTGRGGQWEEFIRMETDVFTDQQDIPDCIDGMVTEGRFIIMPAAEQISIDADVVFEIDDGDFQPGTVKIGTRRTGICTDS